MIFQNILLACATCMGNPDDPATTAAGSSILFLLVIIGVVMGAFLKFIHFLAKCEKESTRMVPVKVSADEPPNASGVSKNR